MSDEFFNANGAIFRYIMTVSWLKQFTLRWDNDDVRFLLNQHAELDFYSASSLKQQSVDRHVAQLGHIIQIPNQPVFNIAPWWCVRSGGAKCKNISFL